MKRLKKDQMWINWKKTEERQRRKLLWNEGKKKGKQHQGKKQKWVYFKLRPTLRRFQEKQLNNNVSKTISSFTCFNLFPCFSLYRLLNPWQPEASTAAPAQKKLCEKRQNTWLLPSLRAVLTTINSKIQCLLWMINCERRGSSHDLF